MEILRRRRSRQLVRELYRAILGREPDPEGARHYERLLLGQGAEKALPGVIKSLMRSKEYRSRTDTLAVAHINSLLASQGTQLVNGRPVAHLASLGSFCLPSLLFQKNGLKSYSLPFDWIFSTPRMVRDCLADNFAGLLDRSHYRSVEPPREEPAAEHLLYRERYGVQMLFAHRDPTRDADYLYFVRCVTRFHRLLQSDDPKLFWVIGRPNHDLVNEFPHLIECLNRTTKNFVLLCVELLDAVEPGMTSLVPLARIEGHELHRFTPSAFQVNGGLLPDKLDEWTLLRLVYRYKLDLKDSPWGEGSDDAVEPDCAEDPLSSGATDRLALTTR